MSAGKAANLLGVSVKTVQRWEREGRNRQYAEGKKPNAIALKKQFNASSTTRAHGP